MHNVALLKLKLFMFSCLSFKHRPPYLLSFKRQNVLPSLNTFCPYDKILTCIQGDINDHFKNCPKLFEDKIPQWTTKTFTKKKLSGK